MLEGIDPQVDESGYPTNPDYLNALGFDPVQANRAILEAQELYQVLADPSQRAQFLQEYDRQLQAAQQQEPQRPTFPGQSGYGQNGYSPEQAFNQAIRFGNPVDAFDQVGRVWDQVPAQFLAEQILMNFPDVD